MTLNQILLLSYLLTYLKLYDRKIFTSKQIVAESVFCLCLSITFVSYKILK